HGRCGAHAGGTAAGAERMSRVPAGAIDARSTCARVFCDTFLFMLMLGGFCDPGHAAPQTGHAYSIRSRSSVQNGTTRQRTESYRFFKELNATFREWRTTFCKAVRQRRAIVYRE